MRTKPVMGDHPARTVGRTAHAEEEGAGMASLKLSRASKRARSCRPRREARSGRADDLAATSCHGGHGGPVPARQPDSPSGRGGPSLENPHARRDELVVTSVLPRDKRSTRLVVFRLGKLLAIYSAIYSARKTAGYLFVFRLGNCWLFNTRLVVFRLGKLLAILWNLQIRHN